MKKTKKMMILSCVLLYGFALVGCASAQAEFVEAPSSSGADSGLTETDETAAPEELYVYVCGEVAHPGVYRLPGGARVYEALDMAGGLTEAAEDTALNQARLLEDGEEIRIPAQGEAGEPGETGGVSENTEGVVREPGESGRVNINTADAAQLATLTGIGPSRAEAIIAWREANGGFTAPEDLKKVDGIADKTFDKLKDEITVR
ncbi:MAG TPA: hypothetical protein DF613_12175 [Lachnospiraceae bacterium]|nr:hypothetical protein [Lachnospiraceae bacterium]